MTIDTACSESLVSLDSGRKSLFTGGCGRFLVGGVQLQLAPWSFVGLSLAGMLSPSGRSKTFDDSADGFG